MHMDLICESISAILSFLLLSHLFYSAPCVCLTCCIHAAYCLTHTVYLHPYSAHIYLPTHNLEQSQVTQLIIQLLASASAPIDRMDAYAMYPVSLSKQSSSRIYQDLWATRLHSLVQLASDHSLDRTVAMETFKQVYANFPLMPFLAF